MILTGNSIADLFVFLNNTYCSKPGKWLRKLIPCLILLLFVSGLSAQKASFRKYSVLDGLPQSQVWNIKQDSRGFIWISTRNGLSRFDGIEFVNYFRANGLPDNKVLNVFEDNLKKLWALSRTGLSKYNGYGFDYFPVSDEFRNWSFNYIPTVDTANDIFILGKRQVDSSRRIVLFKNGIYQDYAKNYPVLDTLKVREFLFDQSAGGMLILDHNHSIWMWKDNLLSALTPHKFENIFREKNNILAKSNDTIFRFDGKKFTLYDFSAPAGRFGVVKYSNLKDRRFEIFNGNVSYKTELPFDFMTYWLDNENVMWFSSEGNMYRLLSSAFSLFDAEEIGSGNIWAISEDRNGHIFFGSLYNSLIEFDGEKFLERNEFRTLFKREISFYKGSRKMSNGDVWFSTNAGVLIWDGTRFSVLKGIPENTQVCYIYEDTDNNTVMLGTEKGLFILRDKSIDLMAEFTDANLGVIEGVAKDDSGTYWLSGHNGVVRFNGKTTAAVREDILPDEYTYTIEKDSFGGLWVTSENGLYFKPKTSGTFVNGLPESVNSPANSIMIMDKNHILVGRVNDICIIDLKKFYNNERNYYRLYDSNDGFMGSDCLDNGIIKDLSGRFWILTSDKSVIFDPRLLKENPDPPHLNITGIHYETDSLTWVDIDKSGFFYGNPENIKLGSWQNKIQISFNGISTTNPEKVTLQYRLEGYDDKWSISSPKRFVFYEKLPPGHYRFHLKGCNADGVETNHPLSFAITVVPSFWQRSIVRITLSLLGIALTILSVLYLGRLRMHKKEKEDRLRAELSRLQMNSVLSQFDPHFTFNVISAIGSLIMKGEKEFAYDYITILGGLLRTILGEGSVSIKPLSDEIDFVKKYCELQKLRFKDRINFSVVIDKNVDLQREIPKMTIQLFVENAIKHGLEDRNDGGKVDVKIIKNSHSLEITVLDNGIGRAASSKPVAEGSGKGLKMITGLFEAMNVHNSANATIEIIDLEKNGEAAGTFIKILIPDDYRFDFGNSVTG